MIPSYILSFVVFGTITPYLSILIRDLGYSPGLVGVLLGVFEGAGIAGPFVFGAWADKNGSYRIPLIITTLLPVLAAPLALFIHPLISAVFLALMAFGFRSTTSLLDAVTTIRLGKTGDYGKIRAAGSISFIVLVLFLQWTPVLKPQNSENIAAWITLSSLAAVFPIILLPRTMTGSPRGRGRSGSPSKGPVHLLSIYFLTGFAIIFLCRLAMSVVYSYFPLYLTEELDWNVVGAMFALASMAEVPCMFISARLLRRFGPLPLLALAAAGISVRLLIWAAFPGRGFIAGAQLLHSLCFGIYHPAAVNFISTSFPPEKRALGMSVYLALGSGLPSLLGNILGGFLVEDLGFRPLFACFSGFTVLALLIYGAWYILGRSAARNLRSG
ncbi:MAG: MFS transporter [Spirochaetaceae bacterium]|jgi:PPP family 3-phenylpropionic acid transporter|nr:MFS transporter [Spirochaetaceae bacterium]